MYEQGGIVMTAEDGGLGFVGGEGYTMYLYSWKDGDESTTGWALRRVIELKTLLPIRCPSVLPNVIGFVEGRDTIFMRTYVGVFTLELKSRKVRKVGEKVDCNAVVPFTSFYAPVHATG